MLYTTKCLFLKTKKAKGKKNEINKLKNILIIHSRNKLI